MKLITLCVLEVHADDFLCLLRGIEWASASNLSFYVLRGYQGKIFSTGKRNVDTLTNSPTSGSWTVKGLSFLFPQSICGLSEARKSVSAARTLLHICEAGEKF